MKNADWWFAHLVYAAWPATLLYPLLYGFTAKWWRTWIGRALMVKAVGVFTLLTFSVLFQWFGPGYYGRDFVRISGMSVACVGFWLAFAALVRVRLEVRRDRLAAEKLINEGHRDEQDS